MDADNPHASYGDIDLLEAVFSASAFLIALLDSEFNFIRVNERYAKADGKPPDYYPGKNHFDLFPNKENLEIFKEVVMTGRPYSTFSRPFEYAKNPERGVTYWDWSLSPIKDRKGRVAALLFILMDVTPRKKAEIEINRSLAEKEALLNEIHHRVKNNMQVVSSLLRLQARKIHDESVKAMFSESVCRIKSMSLVHELFYREKDFSGISMHEYFGMLWDMTGQCYPSIRKNILFKTVGADVRMRLSEALTLGLITHELMANATLHAFKDKAKGVVSIGISVSNGNAALIVSDDGAGLPDGFDYNAADTMGMEMIRTLASQLDADVSFNSSKGIGTSVGISFKIARG